MAFCKKTRGGDADRPEFQNLRQSLALIKDFGYVELWQTDSDYVQSLKVGGHCAKYNELINFLEKEMGLYCKSPEIEQHKSSFALLRESSFMNLSDYVQTNPLFFRLNTLNAIVNRLLQLYMDNLCCADSVPLNNLYTSCFGPNAPARTTSNLGASSSNAQGKNNTGAFHPVPAQRNSRSTKQKKLDQNVDRLGRLRQLARQAQERNDHIDMFLDALYESESEERNV